VPKMFFLKLIVVMMMIHVAYNQCRTCIKSSDCPPCGVYTPNCVNRSCSPCSGKECQLNDECHQCPCIDGICQCSSPFAFCQVMELMWKCYDPRKDVCCSNIFSHGMGCLCDLSSPKNTCCNSFSEYTCYDPTTEICCYGAQKSIACPKSQCCCGDLVPICCPIGKDKTCQCDKKK